MFCYATLLLNGYLPHYLAFFSFSFLPYKKKKFQNTKKQNTDGVKRSQTGPVITKYQHSTSTSYTFWDGIERPQHMYS